MEFQISKRLLAIANLIPKNSRVADIGTDHAKLPVYLIKNNIATFAIAADTAAAPLELGKKFIAANRLTDKIETRLGNGLAVLEENEVDVITICGMGGKTVKTILAEGIDKIGNATLILQPQGDVDLVRLFLADNGFNINNEVILREDGKFYVIILCTRGEMYLTGIEAYYGPCLLREMPELFIEQLIEHRAYLVDLKNTLEQA